MDRYGFGVSFCSIKNGDAFRVYVSMIFMYFSMLGRTIMQIRAFVAQKCLEWFFEYINSFLIARCLHKSLSWAPAVFSRISLALIAAISC